jgi:hypothetical protein
MQTIGLIDVLELSKFKYDPYIVIRGINGFGKVFEINKYQYFGDLDENDLPHGDGDMEYFNHPTIKSYSGHFIGGQKNGIGKEIYHNDDIYYGNFIDGHKNGFGKMYTSNGLLKYEGIWENDNITGEIIGYEYKNNKKIYYGCIQNNKYHGYGIEYDDDCIVRIGYYENGTIVKSIDFYKNKTQTIIKEARSEHIDIITEKINDISNNNSNITLDVIKSFDAFMINENTTDITRKNDKNEVIYVGSIKIIDGQKYNDVGKFYANNGEKYVYDGVFDKDNFVLGSITKNKKNNQQIPVANGKFCELNINYHSIDFDYVGKKLTQGKLYNMSHRSFKQWTNCPKVYFEGTFLNGRPNTGELYKYINENEHELLFSGTFESTNNISIGLFTKFEQGKLYKNNKLYYEGKFSNGVMSGKGSTFYENGSIQYIGSFDNYGERHGQGMLFDELGNLVAEGNFNHGEIPKN